MGERTGLGTKTGDLYMVSRKRALQGAEVGAAVRSDAGDVTLYVS
jgi:hypothetical protein